MPLRNKVLSMLGQTFSSKLQELDLEPIKKQLRQSGWTRQQTIRAINRYKMFLFVVYLNPHTLLVPTQEIDLVWHCHILHTRKYRQDCQMLFGRFIDHEPVLEIAGGAGEAGEAGEAGGEEISFLLLRRTLTLLTLLPLCYRERCEREFMASDLKLRGVAAQLSLDTAFAQTQTLLVQHFGEAALRDTWQEQLDSIVLAENLPQQQQLSDTKLRSKISGFSPLASSAPLASPALYGKEYSRLHRSACGRPRSHLLKTSGLTE